jgi:predicted porin
MVSRISLIAGACMLLGAGVAPASAADLKGGSCCGDLEERVAELEATVARKGNRVVSLQIYGDVTMGLLVWDNGDESDAYVVDNDALGSVLGFTGKATIKPGLTAGFKMELQVQSASSSAVTEEGEDLPGDDPLDNLSIRHNFVYIESERFGRISLGQTSTASDGAAEVTIANTLIVGSPDHGTSLSPGGVGAPGGLTLGEYASDFDGGRNDIIRYDTASIYGFTVSASWGDNDYWDIALRFAKEWNSVKIAAAIAYADDSTGSAGVTIVDPLLGRVGVSSDFTQVIGSVAAMHVPTGLFAMFAAGEREYDDVDLDGSFWYTQAGIERKWLPYGTTTVYGEYGSYEDITTAGAEANMWGVGVVQHIDSAAMDFYAQARFWDIEDDGAPAADELSTIMIGSRIQF